MATTENPSETAAELKAFVHAQRPRSWAQGYPAVVRERVRAYAVARQAVGATAGMIAEELGLSRHSVQAWTGARPPRVRLRQVVVVPDAEPPRPPASGTPTPTTPAAVRARPVLVSPRGYRVEGLDVGALVELLAAVG